MSTQDQLKLTYDDYCQLPDDGMRHEVIDGKHYVTPAPSYRHQRMVVELTRVLGDHLEEVANGVLLAAPFDVLFSETDVVQPDLVAVLNDRRHILNPKNARGAPSLVVEVMSPSTRIRDLNLKRKLYQCHNVQEFWAVDVDAEWVRVFSGGAERVFRRADRDALESSLLPELALSLDELFARL